VADLACPADNWTAKSGDKGGAEVSIFDHSEMLLSNYALMKSRAELPLLNEIDDLLKSAIRNHDRGKANLRFAAKLDTHKQGDEIFYHHILSPLYYLREVSNLGLNWEDRAVVASAIMRHHARQLEIISDIELCGSNSRYGEEIVNFQEEMSEFYCLDKGDFRWLVAQYLNSIARLNNKLKNDHELKKKLILLTGLLIRLDHAASGGLEVEEPPLTSNRKSLLQKYINSEVLRPFQTTFSSKENSLCVVADTGLGKTGLSVLWAKRKKFYILPNRASVNAMYNTLEGIYGKGKVGLLHSTAFSVLLDNDRDYNKEKSDNKYLVHEYEQTKVLSKPVTVCTADQLFVSAFHAPGYEKIYATMAYSDVIIDEIQGFSPMQIVPIISQMRETMNLGARYLVITATLPHIVTKELENIGVTVVQNHPETIDPIKRHRVSIRHQSSILDLINEIVCRYQERKKVLVICNTVGMAQEVYSTLRRCLADTGNNHDSLNLLHSRLLWQTRQLREKQIKEACRQDSLSHKYQSDAGCIWVTTQLVEASLDIDFEYLFTEISTADSLIQRMGRIWRHTIIDYDGPHNIIIAGSVDPKSNNKIYDPLLRERTSKMFEAALDKQDYLLSPEKRNIVENLYNAENLHGTNYLSQWNQIMNLFLSTAGGANLTELKERKFREVATIDLVPERYLAEISPIVDTLENRECFAKLSKDERRVKRWTLLSEINKYKVPIPLYCLNTGYAKYLGINGSPYKIISIKYNVACLNARYEYDPEIGFTGKTIDLEENYDFDDRCI
jgi:CRISPR-associated endonuclease/helicase Cas3